MKEITINEYSPQDIIGLVKQAIKELDKENAIRNSDETFSINQVAKKLRISHTKAKNLIKDGSLKTTSDQRRIPLWALEEYLQRDNE